MERLHWTSADIRRLFQIEERFKSNNTLFNAEKRGEIPQAERIARGSIAARAWRLDQLPKIGAHFGFLEPPTSPLVISVYAPKGGVLKSSFAYNLAKIIALHDIPTLIVGLDVIQGSITNYALPTKNLHSIAELDQLDNYKGLYHYLIEKVDLNKIIIPTSLPTLDVIPETPELQNLVIKILTMPRRELIFKERLIPHLPHKVIIFDNGPGWNQIVENSLSAANTVIVPLGCEFEAYKSLDRNLEILFEYEEAAKVQWKNMFYIPTLLARNNISQTIYAAYVQKYKDHLIPCPIRDSIKAQEARAVNQSIFEFAPTSDIAQDYYTVVKELWRRIH